MFCLPVPKDRFQTSRPWVFIIIAVIDAVLLVPVFTADRIALFTRYAFVPAHATALTFVSAMFLHAGLWHYIGNMWFFWIFGRKVEAALGHLRFAALYITCGVAGQAVYLLLNLHSQVPLVGASGAISGVAGLYFVLFPKDRFSLHLYLGYWRVKTIDTTTRSAVGVWAAEQALLALITRFALFSSVAFSAHVGGFLAGVAVAAWVKEGLREEALVMPILASASEDTVAQPNHLTTLNLN